MITEASEYYIYPVVNAQNLSMINFPAFADENDEEMMKLYSQSVTGMTRDIMWPSLVSIVEKGKLKMTCFMQPQADYEDGIEPDTKDMIFYLKQMKEQEAEVYLDDCEWESGNRKRKSLRQVHLSHKEYDEMLNMVLNRRTDWGVIFDLFHRKHLSVDAFLMGEDFFRIARECYDRNYSNINFSDFLWTLRSIYLPMFWALRMDVPKADLYHCVATGYSGILGSMAKHFHGSSLLISEHGIYTREREEELIKASWVRGVYKNIWIEQFKKMSLLAYEKADMVTCLYDHAKDLQMELGCPPEKIRVTPNGINTQTLADLPGKTEEEKQFINAGAVLRVTPIAHAMVTMSVNEKDRRRMGEAGYRRVNALYRIDQMKEVYREIYKGFSDRQNLSWTEEPFQISVHEKMM